MDSPFQFLTHKKLGLSLRFQLCHILIDFWEDVLHYDRIEHLLDLLDLLATLVKP